MDDDDDVELEVDYCGFGSEETERSESTDQIGTAKPKSVGKSGHANLRGYVDLSGKGNRVKSERNFPVNIIWDCFRARACRHVNRQTVHCAVVCLRVCGARYLRCGFVHLFVGAPITLLVGR